MSRLLPSISGLLFGFGLILSGMTDPSRVLAFLDVAGDWNPALAFVMGGAILITLPAFHYARRGGCSLVGAEPINLPDRRRITPQLVGGAALFGVGWGLSGVCPGPALVIATGGQWPPLLFVAGMLIGMLGFAAWSRRSAAAATA